MEILYGKNPALRNATLPFPAIRHAAAAAAHTAATRNTASDATPFSFRITRKPGDVIGLSVEKTL